MDYNIGDLVVRYVLSKHKWDMVGLIINKRVVEGATYYTIKWADTKFDTHNRWQSNEFDLIEDAKKL